MPPVLTEAGSSLAGYFGNHNVTSNLMHEGESARIYAGFDAYCQQAAVVVEEVRQVYGSSLKCVFKQMPLPTHQCAFKAAQAAVITEHQGKFWKSHCVAG